MKKILLIAAAVVLMLSSCSKDEGRVIPRKKLAKIYAEMLVMDQWIVSTSGMRTVADTSLVYEPIFEKYGYTAKDYRRSVDKYMDNPERYSRILRTTVEILDEKLKELEKEKARQEALARITRITTDFKVDDFVPYWSGSHYVRHYDSIDVVLDTAKRMYRLVPVSTRDTLYDGIRVIVGEKADSSAVDSLAVADTVKAVETVTPAEAVMPAEAVLPVEIVKTEKPEQPLKSVELDKPASTISGKNRKFVPFKKGVESK